jgi:hypothetical protein
MTTKDKKARSDTTNQPQSLFAELDEKKYQSELALLDRYHAFSAELLRIALIGIAAFGFLLKETFMRIDWAQANCLLIFSKIFAAVSVGMFGLSAAFALAQRYYSTEAARFFFYTLRLHTVKPYTSDSEQDTWLKKRRRSLNRSVWVKACAAITLGLASLALAATFVILVLVQWPLLPTTK